MNHTIRERIAFNVEKYRKSCGYKREELSLLLGVDNSYISKLEKCNINITVDKLEQIAKILNKDIVDLVSRSDLQIRQ